MCFSSRCVKRHHLFKKTALIDYQFYKYERVTILENSMTILTSYPVNEINGNIQVPGDKSISHRALMIGAVAVGETIICGLLEGEDVLQTARALLAMGVDATPDERGNWHVHGTGVGGLAQPSTVLDLGNAGTGARLLMGLLASHDLTAHLTGDDSLCKRPMDRVATPLELIGARVTLTQGHMPLMISGTENPIPIHYHMPVPSAQVKSAVLLAGLNTPGVTTVTEERATRDHTELMLSNFGATVNTEKLPNGHRLISLVGQPELKGQKINIPGDPSSAAFPLVAALLAPAGRLRIDSVGTNPLRSGLFTTLSEMGANINYLNLRSEAGEPVADIEIESTKLRGVVVPSKRAPTMIDEYPILAIAAAFAQGSTCMKGLSELRVKESDRLATIADGLNECGVSVNIEGDDLIVNGTGGKIKGGGNVKTKMDHRIAMAFVVAGAVAEKPVSIDDDSTIDTSFPHFKDIMSKIGAIIR